MKKKSAKKATERLRRTHDVIFQRVNAFASAARLNLHKTAHLGNRFKWTLKDAVYPDEFVDTLTHELVTVVTLSSRKGKTAS